MSALVGWLILGVFGLLLYGAVVFVVGWLVGSLMIIGSVITALTLAFAVGLTLGYSPREALRNLL